MGAMSVTDQRLEYAATHPGWLCHSDVALVCSRQQFSDFSYA